MKFPPAATSDDPLAPPVLEAKDKEVIPQFYEKLYSCFKGDEVPAQYQQHVKGMTPSALRQAYYHGLRADHPDKILQRFINHHEWNLEKAFTHFIACLHWRTNVKQVDNVIMCEGDVKPAQIVKGTTSASAQERKAAEDLVKLFEKGEIYVHGTDNQGRPICWMRVAKHGSQAIEVFERYMLYHIETPRFFIPSLGWSTLLVFDMTGSGLKHMEQAPLKAMLEFFDKYYPWGMANVIIHNAPWVFSGLWKLIKGWIPGKDAGEFIHFTKSAKDLEQHMSRSIIPKDMGGDDTWQYKYTPSDSLERAAKTGDVAGRDAAMKERLELGTKIESLTEKWLQSTKAGKTDEVDSVLKEREDLIKQLRKQYWTLDPYVRARGLYDDWGMIQSSPQGALAQL